MTANAPSSSLTPRAGAAVPDAATRRRLAGRLEAGTDAIIDAWFANQFDAARVERYAIAGVVERGEMIAGFLAPVLKLLIAALRTGERRYRDVYLDERLRYAPHQAGPEVVARFFAELLPGDEAALLGAAGENESRDQLQAWLTELHAPLLRTRDAKSLRLLAVGDCLLNEVRVFLPGRLEQAGVSLDMRCLYFSALVGRALATEQVFEFIDKTSPHLITFSFLTYEGLPPWSALLREADGLSPAEVDQRVTALVGIIREFLTEVRTRTEATFLVHNASGLPLTRFRRRLPVAPLSTGRRRVVTALNAALAELCDNIPNTLLLDEYAVADERGHRASGQSVIPRAIARGAVFHTARFGEFLADAYQDIVQSFHELHRAKVLLVDFDNTLWEGVMADGPVRHHLERQRLLKTLKDAGILLVALSKNSPENIRWNEMALAPADFVLLKINWDLKAQSIVQAAQELDLGLDSFVLIDDNPAERELVRNEVPAVRLLDATLPGTWASLRRMLAFPNTRATEEAKTRTEMYRAAAQRREAQSQAFDYPTMMRSLGLEASFAPAAARDLDRLTELVQRTNQFNTTTVRYSRSELQKFMTSPLHGVYVAHLGDKFGKLGLVGSVIVSRENGVVTFDSVVMSCRAMGFGLERLMVRAVMDAEAKAETFVGRFIPTDRNTPASGVFRETGFREQDPSTWLLEGSMTRPEIPEWISLAGRS